MNDYRVEFEYEVQLVKATDSDMAVWKAQEQALERGVEDCGKLISLLLLDGNNEYELVASAKETKVLPPRRQAGLTLSFEPSDGEDGVDLCVGSFGYYGSLAMVSDTGELYGGRYGDSVKELSEKQQKVVDEWYENYDAYIEFFKNKS